MTAVPANVDLVVKRLRNRNSARDARMGLIFTVRDGRLHELFPDVVPDGFNGMVVANQIDAAARDMAEMLAPLPTLRCSSGAMITDADKRRAQTKNRIGAYYWRESDLEGQMLSAADQYNTYAHLVAFVEPDFARQCPIISMQDPIGSYYDRDRFGRVLRYAQRWEEYASELAAMFPESADKILTDSKTDRGRSGDSLIEVIRYADDKDVWLFSPECDGEVLAHYKHGMSRCPAAVAERPGLRPGHSRGLYDDVIFPTVAKAAMTAYALEAADKAVHAPLAAPNDVQEMPLGPDAVITSDNWGPGHGRLNINVPTSTFAMAEVLDGEVKEGMRYPSIRSGQTEASVITGKGVQAMLGTFQSQIQAGQSIIGRLLRDATSIAFEMDEVFFGDVQKRITGTLAGESFECTYTPKKDINGIYTADVTYGFLSGGNMQSAMVSLLQLRGDDIIGRNLFRQNLPFDIDGEHEQQDLDVQKMRDAALAGLLSLTGAAGQMAAQGQDPTQILQAVAQAVAMRQKGRAIEDILPEVFAPPEPSPEELAAQQAAGASGGGEGGPEQVAGLGSNGLPVGVAPGQAGLPAGGLPTVQQLSAGFRGGQPQLDASVRRRIPTGGK